MITICEQKCFIPVWNEGIDVIYVINTSHLGHPTVCIDKLNIDICLHIYNWQFIKPLSINRVGFSCLGTVVILTTSLECAFVTQKKTEISFSRLCNHIFMLFYWKYRVCIHITIIRLQRVLKSLEVGSISEISQKASDTISNFTVTIR